MSTVTIHTFGDAVAQRGGQDIAWPSGSARNLLFFLLSYPEGRSREQIVDALWHDPLDSASANRFRVTLHRLRGVLGGLETVSERHGRYHLSGEVYGQSDVHTLYTLLDVADHALQRGDKLLALKQATEVYRGDYLRGHPAEWAQQARGEHRAAYVRASVELSMLHCDAMACDMAVRSLAHALRADPYLGENYHQDLMSCLSRVEDRYAAVEHYRRFIGFLRDDLNDTPMPDTVALAERLKTGEIVCPHHIGSDQPCARQALLGEVCAPLLTLLPMRADLLDGAPPR